MAIYKYIVGKLIKTKSNSSLYWWNLCNWSRGYCYNCSLL